MSDRLERAVAAHRAGALEDAERLYREVLRATPQDSNTLQLLGALRFQRADYDEAVQLLERAIALNPGGPAQNYNLGNAEKARGRVDAAVVAWRRELAINPSHQRARDNLKGALNNAGGALVSRAQHTRARELLNEALALDPAFIEAYVNLAILESGLDRFAEAFECYERALALEPARRNTWRNVLPAILYHPDFDEATRFAWHQRFAAAMRAAAPGRGTTPFPARPDDATRKLRIGWISSDFREHPVVRNLEPLLLLRDGAQFEAYLYADVEHPDETTARMRGLADVWRSTTGLDDAQIAAMIRADGIDIAIHLAGHFDNNRPSIALHRPAPIQVSFHDAATSGFAEMDYLIADRRLAPRGGREKFAERVLCLPSFYIHAPFEVSPPILRRPRAAPVFGYFGNPSKINRKVVALWAEVLKRTPGSTLRLRYKELYESAEICGRLRDAFAARGVDAARLVFDGQSLHIRAHLGLYNDIDVALDPFPFSGSTGTFEALWMGAPVVTLRQENMAARWTGAMLGALGLDSWVARDADSYAAIAFELATQPEKTALRDDALRAHLRASPLCDAAARTRQFERLMRAIWGRRLKA